MNQVSFLLDFFTSYCFVICTVGRTSNIGRAHIRCLIRCLIPAHTCVCKRDTAAGITSKNNPILSILKEVFLLMLLYVQTNKQKHEKKRKKKTKITYGLLGSGECVCVCVCVCVCGGGGGRKVMDSTYAPSREDRRDRQLQPEQQY